MKKIFTIICLTLLLECGYDLPQEWKNITHSISRTVDLGDSNTIRHFDSLVTIIEQYQNEVIVSENRRSIKNLINRSFDTASGCFFAVGKAVTNPQFPLEAQSIGRKAAAKLSAERWALCLKAWNSGKEVSRNSPPSGQIFYSKSLFEKTFEDTLYVLLEIPSGSIRVSEIPNNQLHW